MSSPRIFDCHSHWGTAKGHIFRTPEALARQEKIWKTKGRYWAEDEMMEYLRRNNVRAMLDLSFHKSFPFDQIREYHDYVFDIARRNSDVVFGHWLQFDSKRWPEALRSRSKMPAFTHKSRSPKLNCAPRWARCAAISPARIISAK